MFLYKPVPNSVSMPEVNEVGNIKAFWKIIKTYQKLTVRIILFQRVYSTNLSRKVTVMSECISYPYGKTDKYEQNTTAPAQIWRFKN